jgi:MFS family permease
MYTSYRWLMAIISGLLMTTSFISLTSFGILSSSIARTFNLNSNIVTVLGVDSFSVGLFVAFFLGHGGLFDSRLKTGVLVSQIFLIVPQFLIPISYNLDLLVALRFFQGLVIMILALFSLQLSGWFRPEERAKSLAFTLGAITLGSAAGGLLSSVLSSVSWQEAYYITGFVMIAGSVVYFIFAKNPPTLIKELKKQEKEKHKSAWKNPVTWIMGAIQIPITWTLFSIGGFLPAYSEHLGYSTALTENVIIVWGLTGFISAFIGAIIGDRMTKGKSTAKDIFNSRMYIMTLADALTALGAFVIIFTGGISYNWLILGAIINGFLMMFPPNYWALPGSIFPIYMVGAGAFGMGLISNSADAIGPLVSSVITNNWNLVFGIMITLSLVGIVGNLILMKINIKSMEIVQ